MAIDKRRLSVTQDIMRSLRHRDFRATYSRLTDGEGRHPILVALLDDPIRDVFARLTPYGEAYVAASEGDHVTIVSMYCGEAEAGATDLPIAPDASFGMLLTYLHNYPGPVVCHQVEPDVRMRLIGEDGPQSIPC